MTKRRAYETLSVAAARFPADETILYDLACVCRTLKRPAEARTWLAKAIQVGGSKTRLRALDAPRLEPFWKDIRNL